jgi:hypothetical protein
MPKSCSARPAGFDKAVSEHDQGDQIQAGRQVQEGLLRRGNRQVSEASYRCTVNSRVGFDTLAGGASGLPGDRHVNVRYVGDDPAPDTCSCGMADETAGGEKFRVQPSLAVSW